MLVSIGGVDKNIAVTSAVLQKYNPDPNMFNLYHCWRCGDSLMQFSGSAVMLAPGDIDTQFPIVQQCRRCKQRHLYVSIL